MEHYLSGKLQHDVTSTWNSRTIGPVQVVASELLEAMEGVRHGVTTRHGAPKLSFRTEARS